MIVFRDTRRAAHDSLFDAGKDILRRMKAETQISYVWTYFAVEDPSRRQEDDFDAYDLWKAPDLAAFDRLADSPAFAERAAQFHPLLIDQSWKAYFLEPPDA